MPAPPTSPRSYDRGAVLIAQAPCGVGGHRHVVLLVRRRRASTLCGEASALFSRRRRRDVRVMNPEFNSVAHQNGGSPLELASTSRYAAPTGADLGDHERSRSHEATGSAKVSAGEHGAVGEYERVVAHRIALDFQHRAACRRLSRHAPITCGWQRSEGSGHVRSRRAGQDIATCTKLRMMRAASIYPGWPRRWMRDRTTAVDGLQRQGAHDQGGGKRPPLRTVGQCGRYLSAVEKRQQARAPAAGYRHSAALPAVPPATTSPTPVKPPPDVQAEPGLRSAPQLPGMQG